MHQPLMCTQARRRPSCCLLAVHAGLHVWLAGSCVQCAVEAITGGSMTEHIDVAICAACRPHPGCNAAAGIWFSAHCMVLRQFWDLNIAHEVHTGPVHSMLPVHASHVAWIDLSGAWLIVVVCLACFRCELAPCPCTCLKLA
jgi:hypothetical protein